MLCCTESHLYDAKMLIRMYRREVYGPVAAAAAAAAAAGPAGQHKCMRSYLTDPRSEHSSPASRPPLKEMPVRGGGDSPCCGSRCPHLHDRHKTRK